MNRESRVHPKARRRAVFYDSIEDVKKVNVQAFVNDIRATYSPLNIVLLCGFLASIMIMVLPIIFIGLYGLLMILIELMGDTYQVNIDMYKARTISYILTYLRNTWWLAILVGGFGVLLAYLRRLSGQRHAYYYATFDFRGKPVKMGYDTITAALVVPIASIVSVFALGAGEIGIVLIPFWLVSGLLFYWIWRSFQDLLLIKLGERSENREMEWGLRDVFRQEGLLKGSDIEICYECESQTVTLSGTVPTKYERERMRMICLGQGRVKRVNIDNLAMIQEEEPAPGDR